MCGYGIGLQAHRTDDEWICDVCGKVIKGKRNTLHLGVISHIRAEYRRGERNTNYDPYGIGEKVALLKGREN